METRSCFFISGRNLTNCVEQKWFPVATLPGQSTFTLSFTSGKFDTNLFAMANAIKDKAEETGDHAWRTESNYVMSTGERHTPDITTHKIELANTPTDPKDIYIAGMELTTEQTVASGKYSVNGKEITFSADDELPYVDVTYDYIQEVTEAVVTNKESAIGEAVAIWPVKIIRGFAA